MSYKITTLRWSAIGAWEYDKHQWYTTYVLNKFQSSAELSFGSAVDKRIQDDPSFIPSLPRYPEMQHRMNVVFEGITLTGTADGVDLTPGNYRLADFKTGNDKYPWTQRRIDGKNKGSYGQLKMYAMMIYLINGIPPEEFRYFIHWLPTKKKLNNDFSKCISFRDDPVVPITLETKITLQDLKDFGERIKSTIKEMEEYVDNQGSVI
jgi:hypothetical protein